MNYRVILRFSLDGDAGSVVRNNLASQLGALDLRLGGTGTWESQSLPTHAAVGLMQAIASLLATLPNGVAVDHVWLYLDRVV